MKFIKTNSLKYTILLFLMVVLHLAHAQSELYNNGSGITVQNGAFIMVQGEVVNNNVGPNIGLINNSGLITFSGNWTNTSTSGALMPSVGTVQMTGANQNINGSQPTKFNNLVLLGTGIKTLNISTYVGGITGVLSLNNRPLDLNSNTLFVTNPLPAAVTRSSGYIISETSPLVGYGTIQWNVGNNTGNYVFPFGSLTANYIPLTLNVVTPGTPSATGEIKASTYPTQTNPALNNRPLPTGVANLNNNCNTEHAPQMLDRFWVVDATNYSANPVADKQFTYIDNEWDLTAASTNVLLENDLQTWYYNTSWTHLPSTNNSASNTENLMGNSDYGVFTLGKYRDLTAQLLNVDSVKCFGDNNGLIQFTTNQGYGIGNYYWNGVTSVDTIKTNLTAGSYTIITEDIMGCKDTLNAIDVFEPAQLTITLTANDPSICKNDISTLTSNFNGGTKPYTVNWSNGSVNVNVMTSSLTQTNMPLASTDYWLNLVDKNNCAISSSTVHINVNELPVIDFIATTLNGCQPLATSFINQSAATPSITNWFWNFGTTNTSTQVSPGYLYSISGTFNVSLQATTDSGCVSNLVKNNYITVYPKPVASFYYTPSKDLDILNADITFHNTSIGDDFTRSWDFGDNTIELGTQEPTHLYPDTGSYTITLIVASIHNCYDTLITPIKINEAPTLYIPNAFTPNGDGKNDVFMVEGLQLYDFTMQIFDRWGEKIFESNDTNTGWDGRHRGPLCEMGVYVYRVVFKETTGKERKTEKTRVGHVTLIR